MNNLSVELLLKQRDILLGRKAEMLDQINQEIADIEAGIETLSGKKVWQMQSPVLYDDQNPSYIKASLEEI